MVCQLSIRIANSTVTCPQYKKIGCDFNKIASAVRARTQQLGYRHEVNVKLVESNPEVRAVTPTSQASFTSSFLVPVPGAGSSGQLDGREQVPALAVLRHHLHPDVHLGRWLPAQEVHGGVGQIQVRAFAQKVSQRVLTLTSALQRHVCSRLP